MLEKPGPQQKLAKFEIMEFKIYSIWCRDSIKTSIELIYIASRDIFFKNVKSLDSYLEF
jgi:hypothetical protein